MVDKHEAETPKFLWFRFQGMIQRNMNIELFASDVSADFPFFPRFSDHVIKQISPNLHCYVESLSQWGRRRKTKERLALFELQSEIPAVSLGGHQGRSRRHAESAACESQAQNCDRTRAFIRRKQQYVAMAQDMELAGDLGQVGCKWSLFT